MCNHENREQAMEVVERDASGVPTVWCDPCIYRLVKALNDGGLRTIASCCGHGERLGSIALADGRVLVICSSLDEAIAAIRSHEGQQPAAGAGEEIMVNAAHDVYTLPLQPSGLWSGPRFVVHVPGPDAQVMPDWDAAPPGATHYQPHQDAYYKRVSASEWYVWSRKNDREPMQWHPSLGTGDNAEWVVRPAEQPTEQQPALTKYQPCGCVICDCEDDHRCHGCGAKHCGTHPVQEIPNPVYVEQEQPENERLRKDAERYRWLRSVASLTEAQRIVNDSPEGMDAAIDEAMEGGKHG